MLKKLAAVAGTVSIAGAFALTGPGVAQADLDDCPTRAFCAWYLPNYEGARYTNDVDGTWSEPVRNDDMSWYNHGTPQAGADHVRIYDVAPNPDRLTLCIHQGASGHVDGEADDRYDMEHAQNNGDYHRWGGECLSYEPELD